MLFLLMVCRERTRARIHIPCKNIFLVFIKFIYLFTISNCYHRYYLPVIALVALCLFPFLYAKVVHFGYKCNSGYSKV
jgi:hypothetical protein